MKFRPKNSKTGFTLVEIMIVVLIIGILLAIAIPNFVSARESSRAKACIGNLKQIDSATQQYCMDKKLSATNYAANKPTLDTVPATGLAGPSSYIRAVPICPSTGLSTSYSVAADITASPLCSISSPGGAGDYAAAGGTAAAPTAAGKFYHGL